MRYERALVTRLFFILGVGILYSSSWIRPKGHSQPQIVLSRVRPKIMMMPST